MLELSELTIVFLLVAVAAREWHRWLFRNPRGPNRPALESWWLPWLGNALHYGRNPHRFLERCRKKHGPAFTTLLAGRRITFLVEPLLISALFRNSKDISHAHLLEEVQENAFGTSGNRVAQAVVEGEVYPSAFQHFAKVSVLSITSVYSRGIWETLLSIKKQSMDTREIGLWTLVFPTIYVNSSKAIFGASFPEGTLSNFVKFDQGLNLLASKIPSAFIGQYYAARAAIISQLVQWTNAAIPGASVSAGTSTLVEDVVKTMKEANILSSDIGAHLLSLLWGSQGNTIWTSFWYLAFLLQNPNELLRLRNEVRTALTTKFHGNVQAFIEADPDVLDSPDFILLESGFREAMRLSAAVVLGRQVSTDVTLLPREGRPIQLVAGETIFVTPRNVHMSADIYENPQKFQLDRFVGKDGRSLRYFTMSGKLIPNQILTWGAGPQMCKGRHVAPYQVKIFVALTLHIFDMEISHIVKRSDGKSIPGRTLPRFDERSLGRSMHTSEDLICHLKGSES